MERFLKLDPPVLIGSAVIPLLGLAEYENGRLAVQAFSIMPADDGGDGKIMEPWDKLSVNLPDMMLMDDSHFFGMPYSHHAETHEAFLAAGLIEIVPGVLGRCGGHGTVPCCKLTDKAMASPVSVDEEGNLVPLSAEASE